MFAIAAKEGVRASTTPMLDLRGKAQTTPALLKGEGAVAPTTPVQEGILTVRRELKAWLVLEPCTHGTGAILPPSLPHKLPDPTLNPNNS
eukprot:6974271-Prorocentrum_lima.AAC.1